MCQTLIYSHLICHVKESRNCELLSSYIAVLNSKINIFENYNSIDTSVGRAIDLANLQINQNYLI